MASFLLNVEYGARLERGWCLTWCLTCRSLDKQEFAVWWLSRLQR